MFRIILGLILAVLIVPAAFAQGNYRVQPGDVLQMEVLEDPSLNRSLLVLPDGMVSLPLVGSIKATGQSIEGLRTAISSALAPNFASAPTVFLSVGQLNPVTSAVNTATANIIAADVTTGNRISVYALGEVTNQGQLLVKRGTTLLQFLASSGGLTRFAATKRVQLRRTDKKTGMETVYKYNFKAVQAGASAPTLVLREGDVIVVPERKLFE